jgi:hypothetical protein
MCDICDGATDDELLFQIYGRIHNFGWGIEYVQTKDPSDSWGYTIGLAESFGCPELALAGFDGPTTGRVINSVGHAMSHGHLPRTGELFVCDGHEHLLVEVHPAHYRQGTFVMWEFYYRHIEAPPEEHRVLEIVPQGRSSRFATEPKRLD